MFARLLQSAQPYTALPTPVKLLCLGSFINRAGAFTFAFLTIYVSEKLGYGMTFAGYCFGAFGLGSVISSLIGGQLTDAVGRKPIMLLALFGGATCLTLLGIVTNAWLFLVLIFVLALVVEMYRPAASAMIGDLVTPHERPIAFSLMYIAFNLGFAVAASLGGFLAQYSFRLLFWGDALTTAAYGCIIAVLIRDTLPLARQQAAERQETSVSWRAAIRHIAGDTTFLLIAGAVLLTSLVFLQGFSTLPMHLKQLGFTEGQIGWLLSVNGILIVLCQVPVTQVLSRFDRVLMILMGEVLIAIGFGLTTFAVVWPLFLMTIMIWTFGEVVQAAFKQSLVADLAPAAMRGRYMGVFSLCHAVGLAVGVPLGSHILEHPRLGASVLWPACAATLCVSSGLYWLVYLRISRERRVLDVSEIAESPTAPQPAQCS